MDKDKIEHIERIELLKSQCKRYGISYIDVAEHADFNVNSFQTAMQNYAISSERVSKAFDSLKSLVYQKGLEYNIRKNDQDPSSKVTAN